jgi:predicted PolB exonuclease-like 3'-5' exonuclease
MRVLESLKMLKHDPHELILFFDLEWVPDAEAAKLLHDLPAETEELDAMKKLWENSSGYSDEVPRPFLKYLFSRIVSIAFLSRRVVFRGGEKTIEFSLNSLPKLPLDEEVPDEAHLIERFLYFIGQRQPQLVGYNSGESDIQVLIQRGLIKEVSAPEFCSRPEKPWEGRDYFDARHSDWHIDLMSYFSRGKMAPRLNEIARLCGFPGKLDVDGEQVADLWLSGDLAKIVEYNRIDTLNTYLVWLRLIHFCGRISEEAYFTEQEDFRIFLETESGKPGNAFLLKFLEKWHIE